jgi:hypothetical protein
MPGGLNGLNGLNESQGNNMSTLAGCFAEE